MCNFQSNRRIVLRSDGVHIFLVTTSVLWNSDFTILLCKIKRFYHVRSSKLHTNFQLKLNWNRGKPSCVCANILIFQKSIIKSEFKNIKVVTKKIPGNGASTVAAGLGLGLGHDSIINFDLWVIFSTLFSYHLFNFYF